MDDKIIFKPVKGTASYHPLIDNIKDTNTQETFAGAKRFASVLGMKHCGGKETQSLIFQGKMKLIVFLFL